MARISNHQIAACDAEHVGKGRMAAACAAALVAASALPANAAPAAFPPGLSWDWQLDGEMDLGRAVDVMALDLDEVEPSDIAALKARGVRTVCYISVGTAEDFRDDWPDFPPAVLGPELPDWPGERYLDIRDRAAILPIMLRRMERCAAKGFDAVEPDNMDLYDNEVGFPISRSHQLAYLRDLAGMAHGLGLAIAQKNAEELVPDLVEQFDFMMIEECWANERCEETLPYIRAGKAVLDAEYTDSGTDLPQACAAAVRMGISMVYKTRELRAEWIRCQ